LALPPASQPAAALTPTHRRGPPGAYLSEPITDKEVHSGEDARCRYGVASMQGWRTSMEDAHAVRTRAAAAHARSCALGAMRRSLPLLARTLTWHLALWAPCCRHQAILELDPSSRAAWFAVFDGHGGKEVAKYCAVHLHTAFAAHPAFAAGAVEEALVASFLQMDTQIVTEAGRRALAVFAEEGQAQTDGKGPGGAERSRNLLPGDDMEDEDAQQRGTSAGCTSVVAVVRAAARCVLLRCARMRLAAAMRAVSHAAPRARAAAQLKGGTLYVANAGDSRAVLCRAGGAARDMSIDHKPTLETEKARILAAGGFVAEGRVKGSLALSRAIGDMEFKQAAGLPAEQQMVTALPEVQTERLVSGDEFLIIACDGIWDVMTSQQAVDFCRQRLAGGAAPAAVCEALCDACCARDTRGSGLGCDNMSVVLVVFKPAALA
jgi:protein phosphatase 1G